MKTSIETIKTDLVANLKSIGTNGLMYSTGFGGYSIQSWEDSELTRHYEFINADGEVLENWSVSIEERIEN